jgi:4-amino-4-deoxy-L-arabinose transferase-like glycosyltransferase
MVCCEERDVGSLSTRRLTSVHIFLVSVLMVVKLADIHHPYILSIDETREAEIAREALVDSHWITPYLSGWPFLEKPPLFYDTVAITYFLTGSISPTAARLVSAIFGIIMLAAVFFFCRRWASERMAWFSVFVLISMPKFFYYSHTILLDIAVGAFCTTAIVAFALWLWRPESDTKKQALLCLFYLSSAGAFLTKGVVGVFHIVVIVGLFFLVTRQWDVLRKLICAWPILLFIVPVTTWLCLFYREGGLIYFHQLFVHNLVGRFLNVLFVLPGRRLYSVDLGKIAPWHFYLTTLPTIVGGAIVILPLTIWDAIKQTKASLRHRAEHRDVQADTKLLLLIWAVVPVFLLSFSAAKETSYILPSYAGMAILVGAWLDERLSKKQDGDWNGIAWLSVAAAVAILSIFPFWIKAKTYLIITCGLTALTIPGLLILFYKKKFTQFCFLFIALSICPPIIYYGPNVQAEFCNGRCSLWLAHDVWARVGDASLYLYQPRDTIRGSISFYGKRTVRELDFPEELNAVLLSSQKVFVLMSDKTLVNIQKNKLFLNRYTVQPLPHCGWTTQFILLANLGT